jgi:hypothetical protein
MNTPKEKRKLPLAAALIETFGFSPAVATTVVIGLTLICLTAVAWVIQSSPPRTITLTCGPEGSSFHRWAVAYQQSLANHGVTLEILTSGGSLENLQRLQSDDTHVDLGFAPGGLVKEAYVKDLVSLGSLAYQPLWVYYRSPVPFTRLSELTDKRIAVGSKGSGARILALRLLQANGITRANATFVDLDAGAAAAALLDGKIDAIFLMGDSAPSATLRSLMRTPNIQLFNFSQADAYVRRLSYLNKIVLAQGVIDFGKNLPAQDVALLGPTVELVARKGLNPALTDLLIEVAKEVHGRSSLLHRRGQFPAPQEHEFPLSEDAVRYYKSGKGLLIRTLHSFWLASLANRILVAVIPLVLVLIPTIRFLPVAYRLRILLRLYRHYRPLLRLERESFGPMTPERLQELLRRLDEIEAAVNQLKVPASFADRLYLLRSHIVFVRQRLKSPNPSAF